jgi:predicted permease
MRIRTLITNLFRKEKVERQLDDELQSYVEMLTDEKISAGISASEARRAALADIGGIEPVKQSVRDHRTGTHLEVIWQDVRYGWRQLLRNPGFTAAVIVTLALSIGANTAIFSIVNALMLKSLPYPDPTRLGTVFRHVEGADPYDGSHGISGEQWELLRDNVSSVRSAVSSRGTNGVNLQAGEHFQYVQAGRISAHYLDLLGIRPIIGRNFADAEDRPNGPHSVILSYNLWQQTFSADPNLIGQAIHLKGQPYTVVGVLPRGSSTPLNADLYTALRPSRNGEGGGTNYDLIVRLRDGVTWHQAEAEINRAWASYAVLLAGQNNATRVSFYPVPLQKGQTAALRPKALALMIAAASILLIACANLAALTLVRMGRRTPEIATRLALGASRWHVQRQLWIENLLLACLGGAAGVGVGFLALRGLLSLLPRNYLPVDGVLLDARVLQFTFIVSLLTSVLFGMLPALTVRRVDLRSSMSCRAVAGGERLRLRQALIAGEIALTMVLLAASGLLIRTLIHLETLPPGFNPQGVTTAKASLNDARYNDPAAFRKLLDESTAAMERIPGVKAAAVGLSLPYERVLNDSITFADGKHAGQQVQTDAIYATPGYFAALQIPVLAGRTFTPADGPDAQSVVIINQTFASRFFGGENPVGRTLRSGPGTAVIVGVVADTQISSGLNPVAPLQTEETMYFPATQIRDSASLALLHTWFQPSWIVRTSGPITGLTGQMQRALSSVDPGLPFSGFYAMNDLLAQTLATQRIEVALLGAMAALALLLSAVGIFALVASIVTQRTREIGIRIALGSTLRQVMRDVAAPGIRAALLGLLLGLMFCHATLGLMRSALYGVGVYDPASIVGVMLALSLVIACATTIPTLRIANTDPARTLREE